MKSKLTILGCGNSPGVPAIGNHWGACNPQEPRNIRTRCSAMIEMGHTTIIIDTGPDFRLQFNSTGKSTLDAVFYSHHHGDHVNGIDDLRGIAFRNKMQVPVYGNVETIDDLSQRFSYLFVGSALEDLYPPIVRPHKIQNFSTMHHAMDAAFIPFEQDHRTCISVGYRFGDVAYSVDMCDIPESSLQALQGVHTWIVDGAGYKNPQSTVHANLQTIYRINEAIGAQRVIITSLSLAMDYQALCHELPPGYEPAYDGLVVDF